MNDEMRPPHRRHRADLVVIIASVWALLSTLRPPPEVMTEEGAEVAVSVPVLIGAYGLGGILGLVGLALAQKWPPAARFMIAAGGLVILAGFFALQDFTVVTVVSRAVPGLALLVAAPFAGVMPPADRTGGSAAPG